MEEWIDQAKASPFPAYHEVAKTLENWIAPILQYFLTSLYKRSNRRNKVKNIK
ncbi:transposase [Bacillus solitudinis]|uniref:transposase n=1 Tax=Bacillus solitudinis TaxID=2014074 RepID=UPI0012FE39B9